MEQNVQLKVSVNRDIHAQLKQMVGGVRSINDSVKQLGDNFQRQSGKSSAGLNQIAKDTKGVQSSLAGLRSMAGFVSGALASIGVGFSLRAVVGQITGAIRDLDELRELSFKLNIDVSDLAQLRFAFEQSGAGASEMQTAFRALNNLTAAAVQGNKEAIETFEALGIVVADFAAKSPKDQFLQLVGVLGQFEESTAKSEVVSRLFGRSYQELKPVLAEGVQNIEAMMARQAALHPITQESADKADKWGDTLGELKEAFRGIYESSGTLDLVVERTDLLSAAIDKLGKFSQSNKGFVKEFFDVLIATGGKINESAYARITNTRNAGGDAALARSQARVYTNILNQSLGGFSFPIPIIAPEIVPPKKTLTLPGGGDEAKENDRIQDEIEDSREDFIRRLGQLEEQRNRQTIEGLDRQLASELDYVQKANASEADKARFTVLLTEETRQAQNEIRSRQLEDFKRYMNEEKDAYLDSQKQRAELSKVFREASVSRAEGNSLRAEQELSSLSDIGGLESDLGLKDRAQQLKEVQAAELAILDANRSLLEARRAAATTDAERVRLAFEIEAAERNIESTLRRQSLEIQLQNRERSIGGAFKQRLVDRTSPEAVAGTFAELGVESLDRMAQALSDIATGSRSAKEALQDFAYSTAKALTEAIIQALILKAVLAGIGGVGGGGGGGGSSSGGGSGGGGGTSAATGGIVRNPTSIIAGDNKSGLEAMVPLPDNRGIPVNFTNAGQLSTFDQRGSGGSPVIIQNHYSITAMDAKGVYEALSSTGGDRAISEIQLRNNSGRGRFGQSNTNAIREVKRR